MTDERGQPSDDLVDDAYEEYVVDRRPRMDCRLTVVSALVPWINRIELLVRGVAALLVVGLGLDMGFQVANRYLFHLPIGWTEELALLFLVWLTFLGASIAVRHHIHFCVGIAADWLPRAPRRFLNLVVYAAMGILVFVFVNYGSQFTVEGLQRVSSAMEIRMTWFYLTIPTGGGLMALFLLERFLVEAFPAEPEDREEAV